MGETTKKDWKPLLAALGHSIGLRKGSGSAVISSPATVENVNPEYAQKWGAGTLLKTMADLKVIPETEAKRIRGKLKIKENKNPGGKPPGPAFAPSNAAGSVGKQNSNSSSSTTGRKNGAVVEDDMIFRKPGFLAPRRVVNHSTNASQNHHQPEPGPSHHQYHDNHRLAKSLFSVVEGPPTKRPAIAGNAVIPPSATNVRNELLAKSSQSHSIISEFSQNSKSESNSAAGNGRNGSSGPTIRSAADQLKINDRMKGIQRTIPQGGNNVRVPGLFRGPDKSAPPRAPPSSEKDEPLDPELEEIMSHESMKNIDPKMVEAILNEVIQVATTDWNDIAGLQGVKRTIQEIILWPLERPDIFKGLRASPRGILFFGPPGTGKTMFGRVIATRSKSTFFNISASSLTSKWIGDGEKMVRALFAVARVKQPSVIFIDEIDSILTARNDTEHESSRRLKTEFLIQFDGCGTQSEERVLVIGVTNRPQELDDAARRRLVKRIYIPLPDFEGRKQLVKNLLKEYSCSLTEDEYNSISEMTKGYSGADMNSLCREAAYGPIRELGDLLYSISESQVRPMQMKDFVSALQQVKSSVAESDVMHYEEWDSKFGCNVQR